MERISCGETCPSESGEPAFVKSPSCARICLVNGTRYLRVTPSFASMIISRLPRFTAPIETTPSISETIAGLLGLRASNNSVTLGRPPVISLNLPNTRGIFTITWPAFISSASSTTIWLPVGKLYDFISLPWIRIEGIFVLSLVSITTFSR